MRIERRKTRGKLLAVSAVAAFLLGTAALVACTTPTDKSRDIHDELVYFKDHRVDLCYAYWQTEGDGRTGVMASVPCEKVQHLLVNGAERPSRQEAR